MSENKKGKYYTHVEPKLFLVECWAREGLIDEQIAKNLGVAYSTFRVYKNKHSALLASLKKGKEVVDFEVENALLKRALGYEYEEVKQIIEKDEKGKDRKRIEKTARRVIPDTTAQIFWLKNRKPDKWRDKPRVETDEANGMLEDLIKGLKQNE